ncbi:MAG: hypothetical protein KDE14_00125 [Rhodobacteraceae bacterium]|nr:hypothetical protein [Paracoccaceae bacterium]
MTPVRALLLMGAMSVSGAAIAADAPKPDPNFSFFVTSAGSGKGGNLGGIAGADAHCQKLAAAVGAGDRVWRAYLSTQAVHGGPVVNARERIGTGPWYNVKGDLIAQNLSHLHGDTLEEARAGNRITFRTALTEQGKEVNGHDSAPDLPRPGDHNWHDIMTGTQWTGMAYDDDGDHTCKNWTSDGEGSVQFGHYNRPQWNSIHGSKSCNQEEMLKGTSGALFYCFAAD